MTDVVSFDIPRAIKRKTQTASAEASTSDVPDDNVRKTSAPRKIDIALKFDPIEKSLAGVLRPKDILLADNYQRLACSFINREILGQPVELTGDVDGAVETLHECSQIVQVPDFLADYLRSALETDVNEVYNDLLTTKLLVDSKYAMEFADLWRSAKNCITSASGRDPGLAAANAKELATAQVLFGAPLFHTPLSLSKHQKYDDAPPAFRSADWSFVRDWARLMIERNDLRCDAHVSLPRLTSQGAILKSRRDTTEWRLTSKVLLAQLALKTDSAELYKRDNEAINRVFEGHGFFGLASAFVQGRRRQSTRKDEAVVTGNVSDFSQLRQTGVSHYLQGRARGIFMASERQKAFDKQRADSLKAALFHRTQSFNVEPDILTRRRIEIDAKVRAMTSAGVDANNEQLCYLDLSGFDTTQHIGFYDAYYDFLEAAFPGERARIDRSLVRDSFILAPLSWGDSAIIASYNHGNSTLSGESYVTVKNNIVHMMANLRALADVLGRAPLDVWQMLEDPTNLDMQLHLHGDDCMRYFGDDPAIYDAVDARVTEFGLKVGRELAPAFLKKQVRSQSPVVYGITGSLMKNRFSEYGVQSPAVLTLGLYDTWCAVPPEDREAVKPLWRHIGKLGMPGIDPTSCSRAVIDSEVIPAVASYAAASAAKARSVQSLLERMYYSSGEILPDDLTELWGSLHYDPLVEGDRLGLSHLSHDELLAVIVSLQTWIIENEGNCPSPQLVSKTIATVTSESN